MDDRIPRLKDAGSQVWPHDWFPYENYKTVHYSCIERLFGEGLITYHNLDIIEITEKRRLELVSIRGRVLCTCGITIEVNKRLDVSVGRNGYMVKGRAYNYHAWLATSDQDILRYDNSHDENDLHVHVFDLATGDESLRKSISLEQMPTLDIFIRTAIQVVQNG